MGTPISGTRIHKHARLITAERFAAEATAQRVAIRAANVQLRAEGTPGVLVPLPDGRVISFVYADLRGKIANRNVHKRAGILYGAAYAFDPRVRRAAS